MHRNLVPKLLSVAAMAVVSATSFADHLYTLSSSGELAPRAGYKSDGVVAFVFSTQVEGSVPVYRFYNPKRNAHFYTTNSAGEHAPTMGYQPEPSAGVPAFFCYPSARDGAVAMTRWQHKKHIMHFYTVDPNGERAGDQGFEREAPDLCHVYPPSKPVSGSVPLYRWFHGSGSGPRGKSCWTTEYDESTKSYRSYNKCSKRPNWAFQGTPKHV